MLAGDSDIGTLISFLNGQFKELYEKEIFWKVQLDTYDRELERYGPKTIEMAESIFETDSLYWLSFMNIIKNDVTYILPIFFARSVIVILDGLQLDLDQRLSIFQMLRNSYESEFAVKQQVHLRNVINKKEKDLRASVEKVLNDDFSELEEYIDVIELPKLLSEFEGKVKRIYKNNIDRLDLADIIQMVPSLIHMHAIRCFAIKPRENELFAYNILWSYHKKLTNKKLVTV
jgi:thiopeptide-type bacteriocin biosynthesis protein